VADCFAFDILLDAPDDEKANHTGISVGNTVHLKYRILTVCKSSKLCRYIEKVVSADVTLKYR
jgi:hypothetical protein